MKVIYMQDNRNNSFGTYNRPVCHLLWLENNYSIYFDQTYQDNNGEGIMYTSALALGI